MYNTDDIGNIAVYCVIMFGILGLVGLVGVAPMVLSLLAVILVSVMLHK